VKFSIGAATHFGWVQFRGNADGTGTIIDWAYEDTAGTSIKAGDTGVVAPPPSSGTSTTSSDSQVSTPSTSGSKSKSRTREYFRNWRRRIEQLIERAENQ